MLSTRYFGYSGFLFTTFPGNLFFVYNFINELSNYLPAEKLGHECYLASLAWVNHCGLCNLLFPDSSYGECIALLLNSIQSRFGIFRSIMSNLFNLLSKTNEWEKKVVEGIS